MTSTNRETHPTTGVHATRPRVASSSTGGLGLLVVILATMLFSDCAPKPRDSVEVLKAMVSKIENALNRRDVGGLQKMGTSRIDSNRFVIDVFDGNPADSVNLKIRRILLPKPTEAEVIIDAVVGPGSARRLKNMTIHFVDNGNWKIDTYTCRNMPTDSVPAPAEPGIR